MHTRVPVQRTILAVPLWSVSGRKNWRIPVRQLSQRRTHCQRQTESQTDTDTHSGERKAARQTGRKGGGGGEAETSPGAATGL